MEDLWDKSHCVNKPNTLIKDSFNLIFCTGNPWQSQNAEIEVIHSSLASFLSHSPALPGLDSSLTEYRLSPFLSAQVAITRDCLKYLSLVAEQQDAHIDDQHPFLLYASDLWLEHLKAAEDDGEELKSIFSKLMQPTLLC